ncbi:MAG: GNAT family N-acetyltransferase, partial [Chloroflexota bacterium]
MTQPLPPNYPAGREADVALRDGATISIRPVRPSDEAALTAFFRGLSEDSRALRFNSGAVDFAAVARRECNVDYRRQFGLVATLGPSGPVAGQAYYSAIDGERAEVAFAVADQFQGQGLGTLLLGQLAEAAQDAGIGAFVAQVLPRNHRMLAVFRDSGLPIEVASHPGELQVTFPTSLTPEAVERFAMRESQAAVAAIRRFLEPRSVAVIGASRERGTAGGQVFRNLLDGPFAGPVYPVNPSAPVVQGVVAYPSIGQVPGTVDLAVIVVPGAHVNAVARECAAKGVRSLVVISASFAEAGAEGRERQAQLVRICRDAGMRLIGPNCLGIVNTDPGFRLNAMFSPVTPSPGNAAFASQSGALGLAAMDYAAAVGLGLSSFVSMGNKADISGNDLLGFWEQDPRTDVILLYLESFGNPRKFSQIARRVGRSKPIVAVKSGRSAAGARAASSHTGALLAASDVTVDALFRQAGVIRTDTLEDLFAVATLLAHQPVPLGARVGIVTNAGGPGILCADTCEAEGLAVPALTELTQEQLRLCLPPAASVTNPVDMIATASASQFEQCVTLVLADPNIDAVIAIFIPPLATRPDAVAKALVAAAGRGPDSKPLLAVFMTSKGAPDELAWDSGQLPCYQFPENAARALAHAVRYGAWRSRPQRPSPLLTGLRRDHAKAVVAGALGNEPLWLSPAAVAEVLACYGIQAARQTTAATAGEAAAAAAAMGGPVALKAVAP